MPAVSLPLVALIGATLIDVSHGGGSRNDIPNATILLRGPNIQAAGPAATTPIPPGTPTTSLAGKFIIPGLVDGFTGMQSQAEANAQLYEGVTTIVASGDDRRGLIDFAADPSPHVYPSDSAGSTDDYSLLRTDPAWHDLLADGDSPHELAPDITAAQLTETARRGTRVIWLGHNLTAANTAAILARCQRLHMATYGEFVATPYQAAIRQGVRSLLHMSRFELGLAPAPLIQEAAADPEGRAANAAYDAAMDMPPNDAAVVKYGDLLAANHVALMPTFSLFYLSLPGHRSLWQSPVTAILDRTALARWSDPATGEARFSNPAIATRLQTMAAKLWALDAALIARHPPVLAASGATYAGAVPGLSLHIELELLVRVGLTPRQALAAATSNYATQFNWTELGAIAPGRRADLVVLDGDPTRDISNLDGIRAVYLSGKLVDRAALLKH